MRDVVILFFHLIVTVVRLARRGVDYGKDETALVHLWQVRLSEI
jgi:hypothetical protein